MAETLTWIETDFAEQDADTTYETPSPVAASTQVGKVQMVVKEKESMPPLPGPIDLSDPDISAEDRVTGLTQLNLRLSQNLTYKSTRVTKVISPTVVPYPSLMLVDIKHVHDAQGSRTQVFLFRSWYTFQYTAVHPWFVQLHGIFQYHSFVVG